MIICDWRRSQLTVLTAVPIDYIDINFLDSDSASLLDYCLFLKINHRNEFNRRYSKFAVYNIRVIIFSGINEYAVKTSDRDTWESCWSNFAHRARASVCQIDLETFLTIFALCCNTRIIYCWSRGAHQIMLMLAVTSKFTGIFNTLQFREKKIVRT